MSNAQTVTRMGTAIPRFMGASIPISPQAQLQLGLIHRAVEDISIPRREEQSHLMKPLVFKVSLTPSASAVKTLDETG